jgi:hypothetical protein
MPVPSHYLETYSRKTNNINKLTTGKQIISINLQQENK